MAFFSPSLLIVLHVATGSFFQNRVFGTDLLLMSVSTPTNVNYCYSLQRHFDRKSASQFL